MSDSDIEIKKIAPRKPVKKPPPSPTEDYLKVRERKITTKTMIHDALIELKTRKGVSVQAIKKFLEEKYSIETDKIKYLIKKTLKSGVEDGSIIQLKGIGASGSFKLAAVKEKPKKKSKPKEEKSKKEKTTKKKSKEKPTKEKKDKAMKEVKEKGAKKIAKPEKKVKIDVKDKVTEKPKMKGKGLVKEKGMKDKKNKITASPKKKGMMKRKSIGSIIKPPKMKPKSKA